MSGFILGKKKQQSQVFDVNGKKIPVTIIQTKPCYLVSIKSKDTAGYSAVQLAYGETKKQSKSKAGIYKKAGIKNPLNFLREIRLTIDNKNISAFENNSKKGLKIGEKEIFEGTEITPELVFKQGDLIDVSGISKGKGFQGVVKRHAFAGGPKTHGQSDRERAPGAIGSTTTPGRVYKGKRMAGRLGGVRKTIKNLVVVNTEGGQLVIKGLIPGHIGSLVEIKTADL